MPLSRFNVLDLTRVRQGIVSHWVDWLNSAGVQCVPVYGVDEIVGDPHVEALDMRLLQVRHKGLGLFDLLHRPVSLSRVGRAKPMPERGEHTADVTARQIASLRARNIVRAWRIAK